MNYYIQDFCCVCLSISNEKCSDKTSTYVDNLTPLEKITTVFSELSSVMESDDRICTKCSDTVGFVYEFHKTCLKNINIFSSYKRILKENQPKKQCGLLVDLNEWNKFKENILSSEKIKIEPPESPLNNDYILSDSNLVSVSHSCGVTDLNNETRHGETETSQLNSEIKIEPDLKNELMNDETYEISDFESLKSNIKNFENISVQSSEEIANEENQELIEDPLREVAEEKLDEGPGHSESFRQNQFESFEEKSIHVEQKIDSESHTLINSERKKPFECNFCGKLFEHMAHLNSHKLIHTGEKPHKCDICGKLFRQIGHLNKHKLIIHTDERPFKCDICGKLFSQMCNLNTHKLIHTGEKPHKCDICGKFFTLIQNLKKHNLIHTGERPFECDICGRLFRHMNNLNRHKSIVHTDEKPFKCDICGKSFSQMCNLNTHRLVHTGYKPFECDICGKLFSHKSNLNKHNLTHTGEKPFKLIHQKKSQKLQGNTLTSKEVEDGEAETSRLDSGIKMEYEEIDLKKESMHETNEKSDVQSNIRDFENISVQSTEAMNNQEEENQELIEDPLRGVIRQNHLESLEEKSIHVDQNIDSESQMVLDSKTKNSFECDVCGKLFKRSYDLNRHKLIHTGDKPHKCEICGKLFNRIGNLKTHQLIHTGEKPHECDICGKLFTKSCNLNTHKLIHTGEKPYQCDICGKSFNQKGTLNAHKIIHLKKSNKSVTPRLDSEIQDPLRGVAEEKSDEGQGHSESFRQNHFESFEEKSIQVEQKIDSESHTLINSERKKPFECDICGKQFTIKSNLNKHNLIHTGEKPHKCVICGKLFNRINNLNAHILTHTGEKPYKCDICGKLFTVLGNLSRHKLIHTGEKSFKCDICGNIFSQMCSLNQHKLLHTGEKPYKCDICEKTFAQMSTLNTHKLIHTDKKPYKCDICGKLFRQKCNLNTHRVIHLNESKKLEVSRSDQLVHSSEKPHGCEKGEGISNSI